MAKTWTDRHWMMAAAPGGFFAASNFVQTAFAAPGAFEELGRALTLPLLFALAYGLSALIFRAAIGLPQPWRAPWKERLSAGAAHALYFLSASALQLSALAALTAFVREPAAWTEGLGFWLREIVVSCWPIWTLSYFAVLAGLTWLDRRGLRANQSGARLEIRDGPAIQYVDISTILLAVSEGNYVRLTTTRGVKLPRLTLAELESRLSPNEFVRTHRTALVRKTMIVEVRRLPSGAYQAVLANGDLAPLSRRRLDAVRHSVSGAATFVTP